MATPMRKARVQSFSRGDFFARSWTNCWYSFLDMSMLHHSFVLGCRDGHGNIPSLSSLSKKPSRVRAQPPAARLQYGGNLPIVGTPPAAGGRKSNRFSGAVNVGKQLAENQA